MVQQVAASLRRCRCRCRQPAASAATAASAAATAADTALTAAARLQAKPLKEGIANFYDESSQLWELMWVRREADGVLWAHNPAAGAAVATPAPTPAAAAKAGPPRSAAASMLRRLMNQRFKCLSWLLLAACAACRPHEPPTHASRTSELPKRPACKYPYPCRASTCTTGTIPRGAPPRATSRLRST